MHDRDRNHAFQALDGTEDQGPVRPGAGQRDIKMIAAGLRLEAANARGPRLAVRRDPVPVLALGADKAPARLLRIVPAVLPNTINQQTHSGFSSSKRRFSGIGVAAFDVQASRWRRM